MPYKKVILILLLINVVIFCNKKHFLHTNQVPYSYLYPTVSDINITGIKNNGNGLLQLEWANTQIKALQWVQKIDDSITHLFTTAKPYFQLKEGLHSYTLLSKNYKDSIKLRAEYKPKGIDAPEFLAIYRFDFNYQNENNIAGDPDILEQITASQKAMLARLITDTLQISATDTSTTAQKVKLIGSYLHKTIGHARGEPTDSILALNAFEQYNAALQGHKIWCGIYAQIFNLFAASAGLKYRSIDIANTYHKIKGSNHVSNEYYNNEIGQWVAVDIMYNILQYNAGNGSILNTVQVKNLQPYDTSITILQATNDSFSYTKYNNLPKDYIDLYGIEKNILITNPLAECKYSNNLFKRILQYVRANNQYLFYSDTVIMSNLNWFIKIAAFWLLITSIFTSILQKIITYFLNKKL